MMRARRGWVVAALLVAAGPAAAQMSGAELRNPETLDDEKSFPAEGVALRPPQGSVCVSSEGLEGQRIITISRLVRVDRRQETLALQVEVIRDLDFLTYRRMVEGVQGAAGLPPITLDNANHDSRPAWRATLPRRGGTAVQVLAINGGDRVVAVSWSLREEISAAFGDLLAKSVASIHVEPHDPLVLPVEPTLPWKAEGVSLSYPAGWTESESRDTHILANPADRFEKVVFGRVDGALDDRIKEWEAAKKVKGGPRCLSSREDTFLGRRSFTFSCGLQHQGVELINETRLVQLKGKLFVASFVTMTERFEERRKVMDAILATVALEE